MNGKEFVIEKLEEALKKQEEVVEREVQSIKNMNNEIDETGKEIATARSQIKGLKDAIHKLKGLDNLEKKNIEQRLPDSMAKNLKRVKMARLYGRDVLSFSKEELAAYILHQEERFMNLLEREK